MRKVRIFKMMDGLMSYFTHMTKKQFDRTFYPVTKLSPVKKNYSLGLIRSQNPNKTGLIAIDDFFLKSKLNKSYKNVTEYRSL